jgi:hypothetical protein
MPLIDPHRSWQTLEARAEQESNELHRTLLVRVRDHMEHEIKGHLEPLMATLVPEPIYHFWFGEPFVLEGQAAVRGFYENMFAVGSNQFEVIVARILVDDTGVVTEGQVKQAYRGEQAVAMGISHIDGAPVQGDDLVLTTTQLMTLWPAGADARLVGEDIYFGQGSSRPARRISAADLPDYYRL